MKIIYEDKKEFAEVVIRCSETVSLGKCEFCPFFDKCEITELQERSVMNGEIKGVEERCQIVSSGTGDAGGGIENA